MCVYAGKRVFLANFTAYTAPPPPPQFEDTAADVRKVCIFVPTLS
jgi:hypothetical protein